MNREQAVGGFGLRTECLRALPATGGRQLISCPRIAHAAAMPVILHEGDYAKWLTADWDEAQGLVVPFPSQLMGVD